MSRRQALIFVCVLVGSVGCDQATKEIAENTLDPASTIWLVADTVRLQLAFNSGGFMSMGEGLPAAARSILFVTLVPLALLGICVMSLRAGLFTGVSLLGLGLIAGGGLGNWLDRMVNGGYVTDFISLHLGPLRTGVFNVADVAIVAGVCLLLLSPNIRSQAGDTAPPSLERDAASD